MCERLVEQRGPITHYLMEREDCENMTLRPSQWAILEELIGLLKGAEEMTKRLSNAQISVVLPFARTFHDTILQMEINNEVNVNIKNALIKSTIERFGQLRFNKYYFF